MEILNYTIVVRGTKGEVKKGVFSPDGECVSGDATVSSLVAKSAVKESASHGASSSFESPIAEAKQVSSFEAELES